MSVRRTRVVAVWLLLAALGILIAALEYTDVVAARAHRPGALDSRMLVPIPVAQLGAVELADAGARHRFERDASGAWFYHGAHRGSEAAHAHDVDPVLSRTIERALLAFGRTRIERSFGRVTDGTLYGVTTPRILILIYRASETQPVIQYAVGDLAPDAASRYVDVVGGAGVVTIPGYQIDNLLALVDTVTSTSGRSPGLR